jgi:glycosyltransferase involved in cell wall biosynthesis
MRVLMVGRTRYRLPPGPGQQAKFAALSERFQVRMLARAEPGSPTRDGVFRLLAPAPLADGPLFLPRLVLAIRREARHFRPDAIVAQGPYEAAAALVARTGAKVVVEIHGDWRTGTRLYGSPARRLLSPLADAVGDWAVRRADGVRTLSLFTDGLVRRLGVEPTASFPAFMDLERFLGPVAPLPGRPRALFVGVLERYKNVDGLVAAWRRVTADAELVVVGDGSLAPLVEQLGVTWHRRLSADEVAAELDAATCLFLPSRSEGLPRIVVEALCRGRSVVGSRGGGIPDVVEDGRNGLLADDVDGLAAALDRVLSDRALAERLSAGARASADAWIATPEDFAARMEQLLRAVH